MTTRNQQLFETIIIFIANAFMFVSAITTFVCAFLVDNAGGSVFLTVVSIGFGKTWYIICKDHLLQS